ncbi:MAG: HAD-IB family phosphatase [Planctomycetota bacterium]
MARRPRNPPYGAVVFDCDSTLATIEGIEELTRGNAEVADLTAAAMDGRVPLEEVYGRRLALVRPTRADVDRIGPGYVATAVPGAADLVAALRWLDKRVAVVSGGLLPPVAHFAAHLGVDPGLVRAVDVRFEADGAYAGFDDASPLARRGGKLDVVRELFPDADVALVGDGATDLEAADACASFIAFAGVEERPDVVRGADRVVRRLDLAALVPHLLATDEIERLAGAQGGRFDALLQRAGADA